MFLYFCDLGDNVIVFGILEKLSLKEKEVEIILQNIKTNKLTLVEALNTVSNYNLLKGLEA